MRPPIPGCTIVLGRFLGFAKSIIAFRALKNGTQWLESRGTSLSHMASMAEQTQALAYPLRVPRFGSNWAKLVAFLIIGYLCLGRSFAYLGLPWFSLYIGELALGAFLLFGPRTKQGRWLQIVQRVRRLRRLEWILLLLLCYGAIETLHGIFGGYPAFAAARDTAFNYYPLYLFLGIWAGLVDKRLLRRVARALAWWNGCYGTAYLLFLDKFAWTMPGTSSAASKVPLFGQPGGSAIALLGLIAFEPRLRKVWYLMALNAFVLLGVQVRSEWLGFAVGLFAYAWLTKRIRQMAVAGGLLVILLGFMFVTRINLPSPKSRGGRISVDYIIARALAPLDKNLADSLAPSDQVDRFAGTASWRLVWWAGLWEKVHSNAANALFGLGYGYPIGNLNPAIKEGTFIQTPHNDFLYALAFSGWLGVVLVFLFQVELGRLLFRANMVSGKCLGIVLWLMMVTNSLFGDCLETPFGAVPFYLIVGMAIAPALLRASGPTASRPCLVRRAGSV